MSRSNNSLEASSSSVLGSTTSTSLLSLPSYSYEPLDSGKNEIRLVKLQAPINSQPVCGTIIHVPLSIELHYWALSYCWGSLTEKRTIILDGKKLEITVNLDDALHQLGTTYDMLWVDAICINQEDIPERNKEVLRMGKIYSLASGVAIWLGVANKTSDKVMDFLQVLATKAPRSQYDKYLEDPIKFLDEWIALKELLKNGYWSRTWIVQELVVSRCLKVIHFGSKSLSWNNFKNVFDGTVDAALINKCIGDVVLGAQEVRNVVASLQNLMFLCAPGDRVEHGTISALHLFFLTGSFLATDPRDKVYGILGMNEELRTLVPHPDYANPKDVVYRDLTEAMLGLGVNLDLICLKSPMHINESDVASWVPNWDARELFSQSPYWLLKAIQDNYVVSQYTTDVCKNAVISFVEDGSILRVRGVSYDKVDGLGRTELLGPFLDSENDDVRIYNAVQPDYKQNAYGSNANTFKALKQLNQEIFGQYLNNDSFVLTFYQKLASMDCMPTDEKVKHTIQWLQQIMEFDFVGKSLEEWNEWYALMDGRVKLTFRWLQQTMEFNFADRNLEEWYKMMVGAQGPVLSLPSPPQGVEKSMIGEMGDGWRWLSTDRGYFGRTHPQTQKGDEIVIVLGCNLPMVLRPCGQYYNVVCAAYVQGIMNGEALQGINDDQVRHFDLA